MLSGLEYNSDVYINSTERLPASVGRTTKNKEFNSLDLYFIYILMNNFILHYMKYKGKQIVQHKNIQFENFYESFGSTFNPIFVHFEFDKNE